MIYDRIEIEHYEENKFRVSFFSGEHKLYEINDLPVSGDSVNL